MEKVEKVGIHLESKLFAPYEQQVGRQERVDRLMSKPIRVIRNNSCNS